MSFFPFPVLTWLIEREASHEPNHFLHWHSPGPMFTLVYLCNCHIKCLKLSHPKIVKGPLLCTQKNHCTASIRPHGIITIITIILPRMAEEIIRGLFLLADQYLKNFKADQLMISWRLHLKDLLVFIL